MKYLECRTVQYYKFFYTFVTGYIKVTVLWDFNSLDVEHLTRQILLFFKEESITLLVTLLLYALIALLVAVEVFIIHVL